MKPILALLLLTIGSVSAQIGPSVRWPTNWWAVRAVCVSGGSNLTTDWSLPVSSTNGVASFTWEWTNTIAVDHFEIGYGGHQTNQFHSVASVGTNPWTDWPLPKPPLIHALTFRGQTFLSWTGIAPSDFAFYRAVCSTNLAGVVDIQAGDLSHWTSGYTLLLTSGTDNVIRAR
jgi:hypothetical protein